MMDGESSREFCEALAQSVATVLQDEFERREDSRAFGAAIEQRVRDQWAAICAENAWEPLDAPGKRDIGDASCRCGSTMIRVDVKTHDLDANRYADGGVCSVDNLLRLLAGAEDTGWLVVLEVAHRAKGDKRELVSVRAAPLHVLPVDALRIENLGTGQLRLDEAVSDLVPRVAWDRTVPEFLAPLVVKAMEHYDKVVKDARKRRDHLQAFARDGYRDFKSVR
jgi:hypothetical protein